MALCEEKLDDTDAAPPQPARAQRTARLTQMPGGGEPALWFRCGACALDGARVSPDRRKVQPRQGAPCRAWCMF